MTLPTPIPLVDGSPNGPTSTALAGSIRQHAISAGEGPLTDRVAWEAMAQANHGHAPAYGEDAWTARAADMIRELFETDCEVFFAFNGTAANSLATTI